MMLQCNEKMLRPKMTVFPGNRRLSDETTVLEEVAKRQGRLGKYMRTKRFPLNIGGEIICRVW